MRGARCAPLWLCLLPPLLLFLLGLFNRFVESNLYLTIHPFPPAAPPDHAIYGGVKTRAQFGPRCLLRTAYCAFNSPRRIGPLSAILFDQVALVQFAVVQARQDFAKIDRARNLDMR